MSQRSLEVPNDIVAELLDHDAQGETEVRAGYYRRMDRAVRRHTPDFASEADRDGYRVWRESIGLGNPVYVYFLYADETLLYVGITVDTWTRLAQHYSSKPWITETTRAEVERWPSEEEARARETEVIHEQVPVYNLSQNEGVAAVVSYLRRKHASDGCPGLEAGINDLEAEIQEER